MQPKQLGPFRIVRVLGRGGMGAVYEGIHDETFERAAVKMLLAPVDDDGELRQRFELEIETLKKLRHPNIVRLYGFGEDQFIVYYVMELVDGQSLQQELKKNRIFTWEEVCKIGLEMSRALKHAHDRGIVHRDIKPANILLERVGGVKLSDFGIAHIFGESRLTHVNSVVGTLEYMSPEQSQAAAIGPKTDMYALGAVLYTLLVGHPPFQAKTLSELLKKHQNEPPEPICAKNHEVPEMLEDLIMELLSIDPAARPANTYILGRRLETILRAYVGNADLIRPKPSPVIVPPGEKRNRPRPQLSEQDLLNKERLSDENVRQPPHKQSDQFSNQIPDQQSNQSFSHKENFSSENWNRSDSQPSEETPFSSRKNLSSSLRNPSAFIFTDSDNLDETSTHNQKRHEEEKQQEDKNIQQDRKSSELQSRETFQFDSSDDFHCKSELNFDTEGKVRSSSEHLTSSTLRQEEKDHVFKFPSEDTSDDISKRPAEELEDSRMHGLTRSRVIFRNDAIRNEILDEIFKKNMPQLTSSFSLGIPRSRKSTNLRLNRRIKEKNEKNEKDKKNEKNKDRKDIPKDQNRVSPPDSPQSPNVSQEPLRQDTSTAPTPKSSDSPLDAVGLFSEQDHSLSSILNRQKSVRREFVPNTPVEQNQNSSKISDAQSSSPEITKSQVLPKENRKADRENSVKPLSSTSYSLPKANAKDDVKSVPQTPQYVTKNVKQDESDPFRKISKASIQVGSNPYLSKQDFPLLEPSKEVSSAKTPKNSAPNSRQKSRFKTTKRFSRFIRVQENELGEISRYKEAPTRIISPQTIITSVCLLVLGGFIYFMLQPVPADVLHARIMRSIGKAEDGNPDELPKVAAIRRNRENIGHFLDLYPGDPRCDQMKRYIEELKLDDLRRKFDSHINRLEDRSSLPPLERACLDALALSRTQPEKAILKFQAILDLYGTEFNPDSFFESHSDELGIRDDIPGEDPLAEQDSSENVEPEQPKNKKKKQDKLGNRRPRSESQNDLCLELVRRRLQMISAQSAVSVQEQKELLQNRLDKSEELKWTNPEAAHAICSGIIELYQDRSWAVSYVQRAREINATTGNTPQNHDSSTP